MGDTQLFKEGEEFMMDRSSITTKDLGITNEGHASKFREVRTKAWDEYIETKKISKRNKQLKVPKYKIDDILLVNSQYWNKTIDYTLLQIVDFYESSRGSFRYFGIVLKVTDRKKMNRIGRLYQIEEYSDSVRVYKEQENKIKWAGEDESR